MNHEAIAEPAADTYRNLLRLYVAQYKNTAAHNDSIHTAFTESTNQVLFLRRHRDMIEKHRWGHGDRAFHFLWLLLVCDVAERFRQVRGLEIGVYKGQVISLWALIARELDLDVSITGISPFSGDRPALRIVRLFRRLFDAHYRKAVSVGNIHPKEDYLAVVYRVFRSFGLDPHSVHLVKGLSQDPAALAQVKGQTFHLIYIDGDHSFGGVTRDVEHYAPLVERGGYLIMDDASFYNPGHLSWFKGIEEVSRACEIIPSLGFRNVLNVGHNRVYLKQP